MATLVNPSSRTSDQLSDLLVVTKPHFSGLRRQSPPTDGMKVGMTDTADLSSPWAKTAVGDVGQLAGQTLARSSENVAAINQR